MTPESQELARKIRFLLRAGWSCIQGGWHPKRYTEDNPPRSFGMPLENAYKEAMSTENKSQQVQESS